MAKKIQTSSVEALVAVIVHGLQEKKGIKIYPPPKFHIYTNSKSYALELYKNNELIYFNAKPYFIHGPANTKLIELLIKLNYNITPEEINQIYIEGLINRNKKRRNFFSYFYKYIFALSFFIILITGILYKKLS